MKGATPILLRLSPGMLERLDEARVREGFSQRTTYLRYLIESHLDELDISDRVAPDETGDGLEANFGSLARTHPELFEPGGTDTPNGPRMDQHAGHSGLPPCPVAPATSGSLEGSGNGESNLSRTEGSEF